MPISSSRLAFLACVAATATVSILAACSDASTDADDAGIPAPARDGGGASTDDEDGGSTDEPEDAGTDAKPGKDANGPGADGDECAFNRDCQAALRCECDEDTGCFCKPGARGTGQVGVDTCDSGNQCASSLCVEGPTNGESICSDECEDEDDCGGKLPRCIAVFGIPEPICAREPSQR